MRKLTTEELAKFKSERGPEDYEDVITLKPEHRHLLANEEFMAAMKAHQETGGELPAFVMAELRKCGLVTAPDSDIVNRALQVAALPDVLLFPLSAN